MADKRSAKIGFYSIVLLGVNGIIGSGIFLLPGQVMALADQSTLLVYAFITFLVLTIAWSFAKCASFFNRNGGAYIYAKEAFGPFIGFEIGIMRWAIGIIAWSTMTVAFVTALSTIYPFMLEEPVRSTLIIGIITTLGLINVLGVNWMKPLNNIVTIAKLLPLIGFVIVGFFFINWDVIIPDFSQTSSEETAFGAAALLIFYAFSGFENLSVVAGEMENPKKNLPIAIMISVILCSLICVSIQLISMSFLQEQLAQSVTPVADVANVLMGSSGKWFVLSSMLISIGGINVCASFVVPRSGEALANDGLIPKWISHRGRFDTPVYAIFLSVIFTALIALFGSFTQLATISVIARFVQYTSTCVAAIVLAKEERKTQSFFKKFIGITLPLTSLVGIGWLITQASSSQLYWGLGALMLGLPLYFLQSYQNNVPNQDILLEQSKS